MTPEEIAAKVVNGLFLPGDPKDWNQSPVSGEQLAFTIADAIRALADKKGGE